MNTTPKTLSLTLVLVLAACGGESAKPRPATTSPAATAAEVPLDLSTPDKAIKSYWAARDLTRRRNEAIVSEWRSKLEEARKPLRDVLIGPAAALATVGPAGQQETFARDITEVKVESESRAVVEAVIRNTTPVPAGAEVTKYDSEARERGDRYKYVLEKDKTGWRVAEIWEWDRYTSQGWKRRLPLDDKPDVPTMTFNGH